MQRGSSILRAVRRVIFTIALAGLLPLLSPPTARAAFIDFSFMPSMDTVADGTTSVLVDIFVAQDETANAGGGINLGFAASGIITDVTVSSFGTPVDSTLSFFVEDEMNPGSVFVELAIGVAAMVNGSGVGDFGDGEDFVVATLELTLDTSLGSVGELSMVDVSMLLGPPALDAMIEDIPTNIDEALGTESDPFTETYTVGVAVPEPGVLALLAVPLVALAARTRRRA